MPLSGIQFEPRARNPEVSITCLQVAIGATGAPTITHGRGATIARTAVGDYTVTLSGSGGVKAILHAAATINVQSDLDRKIVGKGLSEANRTWSFTVQAVGVATEAASGDTITIVLYVQNSSAPST